MFSDKKPQSSKGQSHEKTGGSSDQGEGPKSTNVPAGNWLSFTLDLMYSIFQLFDVGTIIIPFQHMKMREAKLFLKTSCLKSIKIQICPQ